MSLLRKLYKYCVSTKRKNTNVNLCTPFSRIISSGVEQYSRKSNYYNKNKSVYYENHTYLEIHKDRKQKTETIRKYNYRKGVSYQTENRVSLL